MIAAFAMSLPDFLREFGWCRIPGQSTAFRLVISCVVVGEI